MAIKLIALDLDGTTLNSRKELSPRTRKALCDACSSGIAVVPTTGRPRSGLPAEILSIPGIRALGAGRRRRLEGRDRHLSFGGGLHRRRKL